MQNIVHENAYLLYEWLKSPCEWFILIGFYFKKQELYSQIIDLTNKIQMNLKFSNSPVGKLRIAGIAEGISFITLLFIAMPIKYLAGNETGVWYVGWVHGLLFMLYILALINVNITLNWKFSKTIIAFLASLIPFGTFILDKQLRKEEKIGEEKQVAGN